MSKDSLGDRMKGYERRETDRRFMSFAPVIARMDGRGFSGRTKVLERPYDKELSDAMAAVTWRLVEEKGPGSVTCRATRSPWSSSSRT